MNSGVLTANEADRTHVRDGMQVRLDEEVNETEAHKSAGVLFEQTPAGLKVVSQGQ